MSTPGDPRSIPVPVQVASAGPRLKFARRPSLLMTCGCPCLLVLCLGTAMFGYWLRERARERGRERERETAERKERERETVSTPLPSTSSGIIRGTSPDPGWRCSRGAGATDASARSSRNAAAKLGGQRKRANTGGSGTKTARTS